MYFIKLIVLSNLLIFCLSCTEQASESQDTESKNTLVSESIPLQDNTTSSLVLEEHKKPSNYKFKYNLEEPSYKANMSSDLIEISGLSYKPINNTLLAINDELGNIYSLSADDGKQLKKINFGSPGDYEGIEVANNIVYVIKSNGRMVAIDASTGKEIEKYKLPFTTSNDIEGLGYAKDQNALIIACKGEASLKNKSKLKKTKAFYTFDLSSNELTEKPFFKIKDKHLEKFFKHNEPKDISKKAKKKLENRLTSFSPSAIAQHPKTEDFYILSSVGKLLIICDDEGDILNIQFLNDNKFPQPEGICFSPEGNMFISNEGRSLVANILKFEYQ